MSAFAGCQYYYSVMNLKFTAKLIGGLYHGQTREFENKPPSFEILERVMERNGKWRVLYTSVYRLKSDSPLEYEFVDQG